MKKLIFTALILAGLTATAQTKIGDNTTTIGTSSILELESTTQALVVTRVANTAAITTPVNGMIIYDMSSQCFKGFQNGIWSACGLALAPVIGSITCTQPFSPATASPGNAYSGTTTSTYTGGNGAAYSSDSYPSTGVTGLTLTLTAGTLANGAGTLNYTCTGTPSALGTASFAITFGGQTCTKTITVSIPTITSSTGKIWMDRNLGASQVATSMTDWLAYGDLYQWGRGNDDHQDVIFTSGTVGAPIYGATNTLSSTDAPGHNLFINPSLTPFDWRSPQNTNLWQGNAGINNPCPATFHVPSTTEMNAEVTAYSITNSAGAFSCPLKFTTAGYRQTGPCAQTGVGGYYWTSTINGSLQSFMRLFSGVTVNGNYNRSSAGSVRCLQ